MKTTHIIGSSLHKNKAFVVEQRSFAQSFSNLIIFTLFGAATVYNYSIDNTWLTIAGALLAFAFGIDFYVGISHYELRFPASSNAGMLFKVGDVYFVGSSPEEAQLFATLRNVDAGQVEQVQDAKVYHFN